MCLVYLPILPSATYNGGSGGAEIRTRSGKCLASIHPLKKRHFLWLLYKDRLSCHYLGWKKISMLIGLSSIPFFTFWRISEKSCYDKQFLKNLLLIFLLIHSYKKLKKKWCYSPFPLPYSCNLKMNSIFLFYYADDKYLIICTMLSRYQPWNRKWVTLKRFHNPLHLLNKHIFKNSFFGDLTSKPLPSFCQSY